MNLDKLKMAYRTNEMEASFTSIQQKKKIAEAKTVLQISFAGKNHNSQIQPKTRAIKYKHLYTTANGQSTSKSGI